MQEGPHEGRLPRIWHFVSGRGHHRRASSPPSLATKSLRPESSRRFHVTLSMSSKVPDPETQLHASPIDGVQAVAPEPSQPPPRVLVEGGPESLTPASTPESQDIPLTPPESPPADRSRPLPSQARTSEMSFTQRVDIVRTLQLSRSSNENKNIRIGTSFPIILSLYAFLGTSCVCMSPPTLDLTRSP
jgi:hypothetical protein